MAKIQQETRKGSSTNEDLVWTDDGAAIVLDGATGLTNRSFTDCDSDGQWYVETLTEEIEKRIYDNSPLSDVVAAAIDDLATRYNELTDTATLEEHEIPSAAGAIFRWTDDELEYFVLGDCSLVIQTSDETIPIVGDGPRDLDQRVVDEMVSIREQQAEISYQELRAQVQPLLVKHRKMKNQPNGYWALGIDNEAVKHAIMGRVSRDQIEFVVAFTDGFEPIYTLYDVFADWDDLLSYLSHNGLNRAIRVLRAFEAADPECQSYPRLKPSDDVGIAAVEFYR